MKPVTAVAIVAVLCLAPASAEASDPVFAGTWSAKDPGGVGGLFYGLQNTATLTGIEVRVPAPTPLTSLRGDTTCEYGDSDCDRCATDVAAQFNAAFSTGHRPFLKWSKRGWTFNGRDRYQPDNLRPEVAFNPYGTGEHVGIAAKHIQGFVRTNSSRFPYAGSHSHKNTGSIFIVERQGGSLALHSLYRSSYDHPRGVAVLGDGLFVAEEGVLRRFSISASGTPQNHRYRPRRCTMALTTAFTSDSPPISCHRRSAGAPCLRRWAHGPGDGRHGAPGHVAQSVATCVRWSATRTRSGQRRSTSTPH